MMWTTIIGAVSNLGTSYLETRKVKAQNKAEIAQAQVKAKIKQIETQAQSEANYDLEALRQTQYSIKDEIALVVILAPFVGSFLPWTQDYVAQGWVHLSEHAPDWYTYAFLGAIGASMGIRWAVSQFGGKK